MVGYNDVSKFLKERMPEFQQGFLSDSPTLLLGEFSNFILSSIEERKMDLFERSISIIEELAMSQNPELIAMIDEFCVNFYIKNNDLYNLFLKRLSPRTKMLFDDIIEIWNAQREGKPDN